MFFSFCREDDENMVVSKSIALQLKSKEVTISELQCLQYYKTFLWTTEFVVFSLVSDNLFMSWILESTWYS